MQPRRPSLPETFRLAGLQLDTRVTVSLILATLLLLLDAYHRFLPGASFDYLLLAKKKHPLGLLLSRLRRLHLEITLGGYRRPSFRA